MADTPARLTDHENMTQKDVRLLPQPISSPWGLAPAIVRADPILRYKYLGTIALTVWDRKPATSA